MYKVQWNDCNQFYTSGLALCLALTCPCTVSKTATHFYSLLLVYICSAGNVNL